MLTSLMATVSCDARQALGPIGSAAAMHDPLKSRPRLYLSQDNLSNLRDRARFHPHKEWLVQMDRWVEGWQDLYPVDDYRVFDESTLRVHGNRLPYVALLFLLLKRDDDLRLAIAIMDDLTGLQDWQGNNDIAAAHLLFGMSVAYDWLHAYLPLSSRKRYSAKIIHHARILESHFLEQTAWWSKTPLQNHNYVNMMAVAVAGVALYGESEIAPNLINTANRNFSIAAEFLAPDGSSHEGVAYSSYALEALLKYKLAIDGTKYDDKALDTYLKAAGRFRLHMSLPGFVQNANFADSVTIDRDGPTHQLRAIAKIYRDGHLQWLAQELDRRRSTSGKRWMDYLWYDPSLPVATPYGLDRIAWFGVNGLMVWRSSWSDEATWVLTKAGPHQGVVAQKRRHYAGSHIHPDAGQFSIARGDEWLVMDDGYTRIKLTRNHNTIVINGFGQLGEGGRWYDKKAATHGRARSEIVDQAWSDSLSTYTADLTGLYPGAAGATRVTRGFAMVRDRYLVVRDYVRLDAPGEVSVLIHTNQKLLETGVGNYCLSGEIPLRMLSPQRWEITEHREAIDRIGERTIYWWKNQFTIESSDQAELVLIVDLRADGCARGIADVNLTENQLMLPGRGTVILGESGMVLLND